jgi:hypothetical protein
MKLREDELKNLWREETQRGANRKDCLSTEFLARAGAPDLSDSERAQMTAHLADCADCAEEFRLALSIRDWATEAAITHADAFVASTNASPVKSRWWQKLSFPNWRIPAFAMAAMASLFAVWFVWRGIERNRLSREIVNVPSTPTPAASPTAMPSVTPESPIIAQLQDGQRLITLNQQGELTGAENLSPEQQQQIKEALTTQRLERSPMLAGLNRNDSALMSGSEEERKFVLTAPIGKVELTNRPTFRWAALPNATNYVVEIYNEQFNLITASPPLTATTWTMTKPLQRGALYTWQVKANKDGQEITSPRPPAPQARFRILSQAQANDLIQARRNAGTSHLMLGLLYAKAGLLDEAEVQFQALQMANPNSPIPRRLLAQVRALKRR